MRFSYLLGAGIVATAAFALYGQDAAAPAKDPKQQLAQGLPPRTAPSDYQAQVKVGAVTMAAEFAGHSVPTAEGPLSTEDYVVVEAGFYGPPDSRIQLSFDGFSLRINGKKQPLSSEPFGRVLSS